ncbi:DNA topoisomerase 2-associated protein PAT1 [Pseudohyphozyma bogoriensis]|nr:DNA topoisomerase 2-associated protein PAT1 [Pseudohyphozyma bogoriensis]
MDFYDGDLEVYDYGQDDLGALLDEGNNELNDVTFGGLEDDTFGAQVGKDFDFAGSTSRFLGAAPTPASQAPAQQQPPAKALSPWSTLDADPLLSSRPFPSYSTPPPLKPVTATQQPPSRGMRTLEEIEAEMRNQQQQPARATGTPQAAGGRPLTLEEVEAQMMRQSKQPQPPAQQPASHPLQPQQQQHQQPGHPPFPPYFPPQSSAPFPPFGAPPPGYPPHLLAAQQHQFAQFQQQQQQQGGRPGSVGPGQFPPGMLPQPGQGPSPLLRPAQPPSGGPLPPPSQQQPPPGLPPMGMGMPPPPPNQLATLFPPLPSQAGPASLEQQLQFLTMNQHAQHPSLTGAQLQALLQQAQMQAQKEAAGGEQTEAQKQSAAGEELIRNVEERIREHEAMELKRKKKAAKIASMAKHNNLMSNSDKDFITRIQVSQLVTDDPYADDFYFHIMAAIRMSRNQAAGMPGPGGPMQGPGGNGPRQGGRHKPTRRENAMNKMAQNVQRLVDSAKQRNKSGQLSLDGALGKIALRTRSAPRQLLQVNSGAPSTPAPAPPSAGHALLAGLISHTPGDSKARKGAEEQTVDGRHPPLSNRAVLTIVEDIYDAVLDLEQLRRIQPALLATAAGAKEHEPPTPEGQEKVRLAETAVADWDIKYAELTAKLWDTLRVMEPLDSCTPHPFISLVSVLKGKRILPRALRHLSQEQTLTLLTLIVATFDTLDTVRDAPLLDATDDTSKLSAGSLEGKQRRAAVEMKTEVFLNAIISPIMSVIGNAPLRMVTGMLGLLLERNEIMKVLKSKPGIAFVTILLSRAESLNQATPPPEAQDLQQWQQVFTQLFHAISVDLPSLFPSTRAVSSLPFGTSYYLSGEAASSINSLRPDIDLDDEPVWRFLASVAVCANPEEQQSLVVGVREKVLEAVRSAKKGKISQEVAALKIEENHYEVLGVPKTATLKEIKAKFYELSKKYHPDAPSSASESIESRTTRFQQISESWTVLSDESRRRQYDAQLGGGGRAYGSRPTYTAAGSESSGFGGGSAAAWSTTENEARRSRANYAWNARKKGPSAAETAQGRNDPFTQSRTKTHADHFSAYHARDARARSRANEKHGHMMGKGHSNGAAMFGAKANEEHRLINDSSAMRNLQVFLMFGAALGLSMMFSGRKDKESKSSRR